MLKMTGKRGKRLISAALSAEGSHIPLSIEAIPTSRGPIAFYCLGDLPAWRAETLLTKEPETIEWIESFSPGDVLWDIGANVGVYSLYAAMRGMTQVLAFEPAAANYALLNRNIELNGLADHLQAFCIAFNDDTRLDALHMQMTEFGGSMSSFGEAIDSHGKDFTPLFRQAMVGYSVDGFMAQFQPAFPNHIKIDVDGIEDKIVAGASGVLRDPRLKSISIELDAKREAYTQSVIDAIVAAGFVLTAKKNSEMVADGEFKDIFNYQFHRARI
jgi:FkbM family methyltransferase